VSRIAAAGSTLPGQLIAISHNLHLSLLLFSLSTHTRSHTHSHYYLTRARSGCAWSSFGSVVVVVVVVVDAASLGRRVKLSSGSLSSTYKHTKWWCATRCTTTLY